eukprot:CAMPEP_0176102914 /NCGR_PEP_ID=MMETSP0120_2-20121206/51629_1 /TAXON_ID=160619 /ORGANISM="Kryptoperidinium foliaceum, Strain CCMP 1326" /LENGTH=157 /DNA_ID=CAMNT_0017436991 /DNA_START=58 /DNA_END=531 /DNA_ORIENTATION=+
MVQPTDVEVVQASVSVTRTTRASSPAPRKVRTSDENQTSPPNAQPVKAQEEAPAKPVKQEATQPAPSVAAEAPAAAAPNRKWLFRFFALFSVVVLAVGAAFVAPIVEPHVREHLGHVSEEQWKLVGMGMAAVTALWGFVYGVRRCRRARAIEQKKDE